MRHKDTPFLKQMKATQKQVATKPQPQRQVSSSMLDVMIDGREFESILKYQYEKLSIKTEIIRSLQEISDVRKRPIVAYVANVVKPTMMSAGIDQSDDLPFNEMIRSLPVQEKEIDIVLVTPGGSAIQVAKFVNTLRPRFDKVNFILLNQAMSAGTILALSGDEIIMGAESQIGPIDPQVRSTNGEFIPAQSLKTLIDEIKKRGEENLKKGQQPAWTDIQILKNIDMREVGNAINASNYSIKLVEEYLLQYKFKTWTSRSNGELVTTELKQQRATEIASLLCDHATWKSHGHAIRRVAAWDVCRLKITNAEDAGIDRAMRRMWALFYWTFENMGMTKIFASNNYFIARQDIQRK